MPVFWIKDIRFRNIHPTWFPDHKYPSILLLSEGFLLTRKHEDSGNETFVSISLAMYILFGCFLNAYMQHFVYTESDAAGFSSRLGIAVGDNRNPSSGQADALHHFGNNPDAVPMPATTRYFLPQHHRTWHCPALAKSPVSTLLVRTCCNPILSTTSID